MKLINSSYNSTTRQAVLRKDNRQGSEVGFRKSSEPNTRKLLVCPDPGINIGRFGGLKIKKKRAPPCRFGKRLGVIMIIQTHLLSVFKHHRSFIITKQGVKYESIEILASHTVIFRRVTYF